MCRTNRLHKIGGSIACANALDKFLGGDALTVSGLELIGAMAYSD